MINETDLLNDLDQIRSRYDILRQLGHDGACPIHAVRSPASGKHFALKVMDVAGSTGAKPGALHAWQAHTIERLEHPNLMTIHAVHHLQGGAVAIAMDRRRGRTLWEWMEEYGPLPGSEVERVLREVGAALSYLHGRGVVHRGIRPQSIFLDRDGGPARLALFGIDGEGNDGSEATAPISTARALAFLAPEQVDGKGAPDGRRVSYRSDLFSLGLVAYAMLTGPRAPSITAPDGTTAARRTGSFQPLAALRSDVPTHLCHAIDGCLALKPARRWKSVEELLARLEPNVESSPSPHSGAGARATDRLQSVLSAIEAAAARWSGRAAAGGSQLIPHRKILIALLDRTEIIRQQLIPPPGRRLHFVVISAIAGIIAIGSIRSGGFVGDVGPTEIAPAILERGELSTTVVPESGDPATLSAPSPDGGTSLPASRLADGSFEEAEPAPPVSAANPREASPRSSSGRFVLLGDPIAGEAGQSQPLLGDPMVGTRYR